MPISWRNPRDRKSLRCYDKMIDRQSRGIRDRLTDPESYNDNDGPNSAHSFRAQPTKLMQVH